VILRENSVSLGAWSLGVGPYWIRSSSLAGWVRFMFAVYADTTVGFNR